MHAQGNQDKAFDAHEQSSVKSACERAARELSLHHPTPKLLHYRFNNVNPGLERTHPFGGMDPSDPPSNYREVGNTAACLELGQED